MGGGRKVRKTLRLSQRGFTVPAYRRMAPLRRAAPPRVLARLYVRLLRSCPHPFAVFDREGFVLAANRALLQRSGRTAAEVAAGKVNFLDRVVDENYAVFEAAEGVFWGERALLRPLSRPLELFCPRAPGPAPYRGALFFPLRDAGGRIPFGAVMLLK